MTWLKHLKLEIDVRGLLLWPLILGLISGCDIDTDKDVYFGDSESGAIWNNNNESIKASHQEFDGYICVSPSDGAFLQSKYKQCQKDLNRCKDRK